MRSSISPRLTTMTLNVIDYRRHDPKEAQSFWSSRAGWALRFAMPFTLVLFVDLLICAMWMMQKFWDARPNGPVPGRAFFIVSLIGLAACLALPGLLRRPVRSWVEAGACSALVAASVIELLWLALG